MEGSGAVNTGQAYTVSGGRRMTPISEYRIISLTQGQVTLVSAHRFDDLNRFNWHAQWNPSTLSFYAVRNCPMINGKSHLIGMHRYILGLEHGDTHCHGDHIDRDSLNNTDENLRVVNHSQNRRNSKMNKNNTSGYKGVSRKGKRWGASIRVNGKRVFLGERDTPQEAFTLYCAAAKEFLGEFAYAE